MAGQPTYAERSAARRARLESAQAPSPASSGGYGSAIMDGIGDFATGIKRQAKRQRGAIRQFGGVLGDVGSNIWSGISGENPDSFLSTVSGFGEGAKEGVEGIVSAPGQFVKSLVDPGIEATYNAGGGSSSRMQRLGAKTLVGAEMLLPFKGARSALAAGPKAVGRGITSAAAKAAESKMFTPKPKPVIPPAFTGTGSAPAGSVVSPPGGGTITVPKNPLEAPISGTGLKPTFQVGQTPPTPSFSARQPGAWPAAVTNMQVPGAGTTMPAKVPPAFAKTTLPKMVEQHGVKEAAKRAGLTPQEMWSGVLSDVEPVIKPGPVQITPKAPPPVAPPPPKPKAKAAAPKTEAPPKAAPKPKIDEYKQYPNETLEAMVKRGNKKAAAELDLRKAQTPQPKPSKSSAAEQLPKSEKPVTAAQIKAEMKTEKPKASKQRPYAQMGDDALSNKAAKGDANAIAELAVRREAFEKEFQARLKAAAEVKTKPAGKGPLARLKSETGSVGKDIKQRQISRDVPETPDEAARRFGQEMEGDRAYQQWLDDQEISSEGLGNLPHDIRPDIQMAQEAGPGGGFSPRFRRMLSDESGQAPAGLFAPSTIAAGVKRGARELNDLRLTMFLAGKAPIKSVLGNIGAAGALGLERGTTAPIRELFSKQTASDWMDAWRSGGNQYTHAGQTATGQTPTFMSRFNYPGRFMEAGDTASQKAFGRAGISQADAQEALLTNPNAAPQALGLNSPLGQYLVPFRKTPANMFAQGMTRPFKHKGIGLGAAGAGYAAGSMTDDPATLSMMSAAMGPYALPFLIGAMPSAGFRGVQGISPIPEWSLQKMFSENPAEQFVPNFAKTSGLEKKKSTGRKPVKHRSKKEIRGR